MRWRAFDKSVKGSRLRLRWTRSVGISIDLELEVLCKKEPCAKSLVVDVRQCTAPRIHAGDGTPRGCSSFKRQYACSYTRGSVRSASGFVLTGKQESNPIDRLICRQAFLEYFES